MNMECPSNNKLDIHFTIVPKNAQNRLYEAKNRDQITLQDLRPEIPSCTACRWWWRPGVTQAAVTLLLSNSCRPSDLVQKLEVPRRLQQTENRPWNFKQKERRKTTYTDRGMRSFKNNKEKDETLEEPLISDRQYLVEDKHQQRFWENCYPETCC